MIAGIPVRVKKATRQVETREIGGFVLVDTDYVGRGQKNPPVFYLCILLLVADANIFVGRPKILPWSYLRPILGNPTATLISSLFRPRPSTSIFFSIVLDPRILKLYSHRSFSLGLYRQDVKQLLFYGVKAKPYTFIF